MLNRLLGLISCNVFLFAILHPCGIWYNAAPLDPRSSSCLPIEKLGLQEWPRRISGLFLRRPLVMADDLAADSIGSNRK